MACRGSRARGLSPVNRIVHIGTGAFHRAHQAWYVAQAGGGWRIDGISLRSPAVRDALVLDDFAYALEISDAQGRRIEVIDVIESMTVAPQERGAVAALIARENTALVTVTVTEKGYHLRGDGTLDLAAVAPDIAALREGGEPVTMPGHLLAGLALRQAPLTVMSCDNLPDNGKKLKAALLALAQAVGIDPSRVTRHAFPSTMVDRITPAPDDALRARVRAAGAPSQAPVATEAFTEWVIEDAFAGPMPDFAAASAQIVADVGPHELRKLRMLNGAHSTLAYAGLNKGLSFVHEAVGDPNLRQLARGVMDEAAATLPETIRAKAPAYAEALLLRFENPSLAHSLRQIAMDGSLKLPIRILSTMAARPDSPACARALRAWECWLDAEFAAGRMPDDPAAERLRAGRARGLSARAILEDLA
ncbi:Mannitol 2-dehydrogenase [Roseobacter fucihabitans]|uniref:Mannitol 2-dehydrogenase n=1 Tax=Roseobacter fucihabitans TaxID=1537242 RepID=A0ABZ2BSP3_9RHOB|nr:mannitol dehydrogenase family protein [Roseobacter litoralis]MBC6964172.1 Mannitol 2-dehydrogenase [Roseobacter litoralis]